MVSAAPYLDNEEKTMKRCQYRISNGLLAVYAVIAGRDERMGDNASPDGESPHPTQFA